MITRVTVVPSINCLEKVLSQCTGALAKSGIDVVPRGVINGGGGSGENTPGGSGSLIEAMIAVLLSDRLKGSTGTYERGPLAAKLREDLAA